MASDTRDRILEAARLTVQSRGYAGLSFRELAKVVGIRSASIHYHFSTKGELGGALAARYADDFAAYLDGLLLQDLDVKTRLRRYTDFFANTLRGGDRMCLAGILAAERNELPDEVRAEVVRFGDVNERWIARVLAEPDGLDAEETRARARAIFAAVSGAQLAAYGRGDASAFADIVETFRALKLLP